MDILIMELNMLLSNWTYRNTVNSNTMWLA